MEQHAFSEDAASVRAPPFRTEPDPAAIKPMGERRASKEDEFQQPTDSPLRHDAVGRKTTSDATQHQYGDRSNPGDPPKRTSRISGGSDRSVEQSPLHPHNQVKAAAKSGVSSPSWERKGSSEGGHVVAPNTPSRLKMRTGGRGDESPEKGAAVPKFGEWDESNPSSADGFTHIFNKVREEKQTGSAKVPMISNDSMYLNSYNQGGGRGSSGCWCFNWRKK